MTQSLMLLKKQGQIISSDLAALCNISEQDLIDELYPHVASGAVMACDVIRDGKKSVEYRLTGSFPKVRPGPKIGGSKCN